TSRGGTSPSASSAQHCRSSRGSCRETSRTRSTVSDIPLVHVMYHGLIRPLVHDPYHAVPERALPQVKPGTDPRTRPYHRGEEGVVRRPPPKGGRGDHALPLAPD